MSSLDDPSSPVPSAADSPLGSSGSPVAVDPAITGGPSRRPGVLRVLTTTLAAGLIAGLGAWFLTEPIYGKFQPPPQASKGLPTPEESDANARRAMAGESVEVSISNAVLGAVLGLTLGLAGGLARGSVRAGLTAGVSGLVVAAIGGFVASRLTMPSYFALFRPDGNTDLGVAILFQGAVGAVIGAAAGAAFGLGLGDDGRRLDYRVVVGGLLGAVAGVVVYQVVGAIAFPLDSTTFPISATATTRLLAQASLAICIAIGVVLTRSLEARAR